jgi:hypothetical protein
VGLFCQEFVTFGSKNLNELVVFCFLNQLTYWGSHFFSARVTVERYQTDVRIVFLLSLLKCCISIEFRETINELRAHYRRSKQFLQLLYCLVFVVVLVVM